MEDFPIVSASTDQEEAALAAKGSGFKSLPVVDQDQRLIGQITTKMLERVCTKTHVPPIRCHRSSATVRLGSWWD